MKKEPLVTIITNTWGEHINLAEEAVASFLRQDYPHKKLMIVNTHQDPVILEGYYPEIEIYNIPDVFVSLCDKFLWGIDKVKEGLWGLFDDDDIALPWFISERVEAYLAHKTNGRGPVMVSHSNSYYSEKNVIKSLVGNGWTNRLYEPIAVNEILRKYPDIKTKFEFDQQIVSCFPVNIDVVGRPAYIYRWDSGSYHYSGSGAEGRAESWERGRAIAAEKRRTTPWQPKWNRDYEQDVKDFLHKQENNYGTF